MTGINKATLEKLGEKWFLKNAGHSIDCGANESVARQMLGQLRQIETIKTKAEKTQLISQFIGQVKQLPEMLGKKFDKTV